MTDTTTETSPETDEAPESPEFTEDEAAAIAAEVERRETVIHDLVNAAVDGKPSDFMDSFDKEIKHRLSHVIAQDKIDIQASLIGGPNELDAVEAEENSVEENTTEDGRKVYSIDVDNLSKEEAEKLVHDLTAKHKED